MRASQFKAAFIAFIVVWHLNSTQPGQVALAQEYPYQPMPQTSRQHWDTNYNTTLQTSVGDVLADAGDGADGQLDLVSLDERIRGIEEMLEAEQQAAEEAAEKAKIYQAPKKPSWSWTGRIHADYWGYPRESEGIGFFEHPDPTNANFGTDTENRFAFRRLRLGMKGDVFETMLYKLEVDYNNPGTPEYKDIYFGWKELPNNQTLLLGNQKRPLGMDHLNSSRYNVFMERPLVVEAFNEDARRIGLAMYGFTDNELYHWRYGAYSLENTSTDGRFIGDSLQLSANARLSSSPWYDYSSGGRGYLHWAVAGMYARPDGDRFPGDTNNNDGRFRTRGENRSDQRWLNTGRIAGIDEYEILAAELALNIGAFQVVSEFQANWTIETAGRIYSSTADMCKRRTS